MTQIPYQWVPKRLRTRGSVISDATDEITNAMARKREPFPNSFTVVLKLGNPFG
mgnify:CR=1 FL=1